MDITKGYKCSLSTTDFYRRNLTHSNEMWYATNEWNSHDIGDLSDSRNHMYTSFTQMRDAKIVWYK